MRRLTRSVSVIEVLDERYRLKGSEEVFNLVEIHRNTQKTNTDQLAYGDVLCWVFLRHSVPREPVIRLEEGDFLSRYEAVLGEKQ